MNKYDIFDNPPELIEHEKHAGFYHIPNYSNYIINDSGVIYSILSKRTLSNSICHRGYASITLTTDVRERHSYPLHRIVALMFKHPGKHYRDLEVNHIDGNKLNNHISNLEWVTPSQNVKHAIANKLNEQLPKPIEVYDVLTNKITVYPSIKKTMSGVGLSKDVIAHRANTDGQRIFPEMKMYRWYGSKTPWKTYDKENPEADRHGVAKPILLRDVFSGYIHRYEKAAELCGVIGKSPSYVSTIVNDPRQPITLSMHQIKWDDGSEWIDHDDPYHAVRIANPDAVLVKVTRPSDGFVHIFTSCTNCAYYCGILPTTLDWRLKHKDAGKKVYPDGYTYEYYKPNT